MLASAYADMVYLERPISRRQRMDIGHRAKQFAPFAALRGFEEAVRKKEIIYEEKKELSEEKQCEIDQMLNRITDGMCVQATYFVESPKDPKRGQYHQVKGKVSFFNHNTRLRIGNTEIKMIDIADVLIGEEDERFRSSKQI